MTHKLSKHVHSFIHLLRSNLFTELQQNLSVQNAFLKRNASKAFHIYTGRNTEKLTSHIRESSIFFLITRIAQFIILRQLLQT